MTKQTVVIDTNVILSALMNAGGNSFKLISMIGTDKFDFVISVPLVLEYEKVLKDRLDRNVFTDSDIDEFIDYLCLAGIKIKIFYLWRPCLKDPFDDHVLELAMNANAEKIITFNKKDFLKAEELGIQIQNPKEFLDEIEEQ